jgi:uncharacterized protein (DUF488 family)
MPISTAGYEGQTISAFIRRLQNEAITLVVDVREMPLSRKRGFSKTGLAAALKRQDIGYVHVRELGCPKPIRDHYREDGNWARYTRAFLAHLQRQQLAIKQLADLAQRQSLALLCYEADPARCHRSYVAYAVADLTGGQVAHIRADDVSSKRATAVAGKLLCADWAVAWRGEGDAA